MTPPESTAAGRDEPFRYPITVRFGDIDQAGIVYYPRFLHYCHVAMEELFSQRVGIGYPELLRDHRVGFPTVRLSADFRRPLRYGDRVEVAVELAQLGQTSATWRFRLTVGDGATLVAEAEAITVATDLETFVKTPIPDWLRARLTAFLATA